MFTELCKTTHPTIIVGKCPWCGAEVRAGQAAPDLSLGLPDEIAADIAICNLPKTGKAADEVLPLVKRAAEGADDSVLHHAAIEWLKSYGMWLSDEKAQQYEGQLLGNPDDFSLRVVLLHYYFRSLSKPDGYRHDEARRANCLWLVTNRPSSSISSQVHLDQVRDRESYEEARRLWCRHVEENPAVSEILRNAAFFFLKSEPPLAERFLKMGQHLQPTESTWAFLLGNLYGRQIESASGEERRRLAELAVEQFQTARHCYSESGFPRFFHNVFDLGWAALEAGDVQQATECAEGLLQLAQNMEHASDHALQEHFMLLGLISLKAGDLENARWNLFEMGKAFLNARSQGCGPETLLARELLRKGDQEPVIHFLEMCGEGWAAGQEDIQACIARIKRGEPPGFEVFMCR